MVLHNLREESKTKPNQNVVLHGFIIYYSFLCIFSFNICNDYPLSARLLAKWMSILVGSLNLGHKFNAKKHKLFFSFFLFFFFLFFFFEIQERPSDPT